MTKAMVFTRYLAIVGFSLALSVTAVPSGTAEPESSSRAGSSTTEPAVLRVHRAVDAARRHDPIPDQLQPALAGLHHDYADLAGCNYTTGQHRLCRRGAVHGTKTLVVLGDSHARAWIPAVETIAARTGYAAYYLAKPGCTAARVIPDHGEGGFVGCVEWREWALGAIRRLRPDVLIVTSAFPDGVVGPGGHRVTRPADIAARVRAGLVSTIRAVRDRVGHVFVLSDAPGLTDDPASCLAVVGADLGSCASPPSDAAQLHFTADRTAARQTHTTFVDARSWFCSDGLCPAVVGTTVTYRDGGHMTTVYSRSLDWPLQHALRLAHLVL
ncbi:MAG TPA: SGNH hydrolase domain-containing protein [Nocardioidaceae bacterium]|nr:SGNH hydrolase domain-containing protein [Nocardioidaceae bacterium]